VSSPARRRLTDADLSVAVVYVSPRDAAAACKLARELAVPCLGPGQPCAADLCLVLEAGLLSIRDNRGRGLRPLSIDLGVPGSLSKKQLLGQAVGRRTGGVVDATAGWGIDARRLRAMGYPLTLLERNPIMAALLGNAARRASADSSGCGGPALTVVATDAIDYLRARPRAWDCVYLDPMFAPKRRASTLARRPLRLLRELSGEDQDRGRLFEAAMGAAAKRVVVKRPDHTDVEFGAPSRTVAGKLVRYDVYFI